MEKYITFSVPIKKECDGGKTITRKLRLIDSFRFMSTSLSELNRLIYKCKECKEEWKRPINGLIENFLSIYQFCNGNLNKFVTLLRTGVYPYEYMDSWEKFDETVLPPKEAFYSNLNYKNVEKWFDTSNCDKNDKRPLPIGKNKKVPGLFKDELGGKIITEFVALRPKAYSYLDDDGNEHKKSKGTKRCVIKQKKHVSKF